MPVLAAVAGVVVAHVVDYMVLFPHAGQRIGHLDATGHAYWPVAVSAAAGAAAVALLLAGARGALRLEGATVGFRGLVLWQAGAFALMEVSERLVAGIDVSTLLHSPEIWFGLLLQLPVAWLVTRVLGAVERVAARIVRSVRATRRRPPARLPRPAGALGAMRSAVVARSSRPRAPPLHPSFA